MSNYVQTTFFTPKDTLPTTNPAKTIFGAAYDVEFGNIAAAIASKYDNTTSAPSLLSLTVGTPAGGNLGAGSINAQSIFVNNVAVALTGSGVTSITGTANQITASASTGAITLSLSQNVIIPTPAAGTALTINGVTGATMMSFQGVAGGNIATFNGVGANAGVTFQQSGSAIGDIGSGNYCVSGGIVTDFALTSRTGSLVFGTASLTRVTIANAGNVVIAAPSSGTTFTVNGVAGGQVAQFSGPSGTSGVIIAIGALSTDATLRVLNATASANYFEIFGDGHGFITPLTAGGITWTVGGNFAIAAPNSGVALQITGVANTDTVLFVAPNTANQSFGLEIRAGTSASDYALAIANAAASIMVKVFGDGGIVLGAPTGGDQGLGTLNATGLFVNGVDARAAGSLTGATLNATVVNSSLTSVGTLANLTVSGTITNAGIATTGSFTGTLATGGTTTPTTTCKYTKVGNSVTLRIAAVTYVSNATGMTMTGLPAAIQPATGVFTTASASITNNGNAQAGSASISGGTMTFTTGVAGSFSTTGFTGSGTKGFLTDTVFCWDIN